MDNVKILNTNKLQDCKNKKQVQNLLNNAQIVISKNRYYITQTEKNLTIIL